MKSQEEQPLPPLRGIEGVCSYHWQTADVTIYEILKNNARANRSNPTDAERIFWHYAKSNGLGQKCRRQYIIGEYIVDFLFRDSMLIVEIDGGYHNTAEQQDADRIRQQWLENKGYRIMRFSNDEVIANTDKVINQIKNYLSSIIPL